MKFKINFKETPRNITKIRVLTNAKVFFQKKILNMTTFKFVKCCDCHNHINKSATMPHIWLTYTWNPLVNKFMGISLKHTSTLDLLTSVAPRCSYGTQWKCSIEQTNEEIPLRGTTYWALTIWSWNFNSTTYLETQPNLHNSQEFDT
jgi:hypothetical protein